MPVICSYGAVGQIPGIVAAAPEVFYHYEAHLEQQIVEQWNTAVRRAEPADVTREWAFAMTTRQYVRPWWLSVV